MAPVECEALPVGRDEVVPAIGVAAGMWMLDAETGRWGEVLDARRGDTSTWAVNTWKVDLRVVGLIWLDLHEPVTVRVPDLSPVPTAVRVAP